MDRTEQIKGQAYIFAEKHAFRVPYDGSSDFYDRADLKAFVDGFTAGAEWADMNPNKRLVDIGEAIRWLKDNASRFVYKSVCTNEAVIDENWLAEEFHDAMINKDGDNAWYVDNICDKCDKAKYCSQSNYMNGHCDKRQ